MKKFNSGANARAIARERIGQPASTKVRKDKRKKKPKHKKFSEPLDYLVHAL
jgi:hypothetical protein